MGRGGIRVLIQSTPDPPMGRRTVVLSLGQMEWARQRPPLAQGASGLTRPSSDKSDRNPRPHSATRPHRPLGLNWPSGLTNLTKFSAIVTFRVWRSFSATHGPCHDKPYKPYRLFRQKKFSAIFFLCAGALRQRSWLAAAPAGPKSPKKSVRFIRFVVTRPVCGRSERPLHA